MEVQVPGEILRVLAQMPDPRHHNQCHKLLDILTIALFGVLCGADGWVGVVAYARAKEAWLKTFLELPGGLPSHDTFGRVFARLDPEAFEKCFQEWVAALVDLSGGKLVAIDGKSLKSSFEGAWDKAGMAHLVSAFVQANHLLLGQVQTAGKGQEIAGIEQLLKLLDLEGAVVTIDALGCQRHIATLIREAQADYILHVKANQGTLWARVKTLLAQAVAPPPADGRPCPLKTETCQSVTQAHGRLETRKITVLWGADLGETLTARWPGVKSLILLERTREVDGKVSQERHYYISTLDRRRRARQFLDYIRGHWAIENNAHWHLDVSFREDARRIHKGHGAENFSRLCRIGLNLLKHEKTRQTGIAIKRQTCGWDNQYLLKVVAG